MDRKDVGNAQDLMTGRRKKVKTEDFRVVDDSELSAEVTRQVVEMGGVGSNPSELGSGVQPVLSVGTSETISQHPSVLSLDEQHPQPTDVDFDASLLYKTLVADGPLLGGWQPGFLKLVQAARPARDRQLRAFSRVKNENASVWLHSVREDKAHLLKNEKKEAEQFFAAWELKPRRYKSKFQKSLFSGLTARKDAEEVERTRWIHELSLLVSGTPTPMGKLLADKPRNVSMLGGGLRASTLRSRVRVLKKFFSRSNGTGTLHKLSEGEALRTVQPRSTEKHECGFLVLRRSMMSHGASPRQNSIR